MNSPVSREIGHDEYDPWGTLALIALYFVALVLMWLFTYFVEFVGNDLTVYGTVVSVILG
ncbi:cytochrome oxidase [Natrinema saccharevitans]|uniref:Cytochrome oxidase n=1 Tax=Natrinema saccharevitans TaxID=301967 RepID=A0A1S8AUA5_9EURY|nr:cytochrome oxidase [Natrinema saccharevitans]OLZ40478.1 cytochrome oxidase [Natrinema saccharevitans]